MKSRSAPPIMNIEMHHELIVQSQTAAFHRFWLLASLLVKKNFSINVN